MPPEGNRGLVRDLALLDVLARAAGEGELRLTDIASRTGREKSQISRALYRLAEVGLVEQVDGRGWRLGWKLYALAAQSTEAGLVSAARPAMRKFVAAVHETVHLCVLRGSQLLTVHSETAEHGYRGVGWVGVAMPAHATSAGRVLLAELRPDAVEAMYPPGSGLVDALPSSRLQTAADLYAELERIRRRGAAVVREELEPGLVGASATVRDFRGAIASLNVAAPAARLAEQLEDIADRLVLTAAAISRLLGAGSSSTATPYPPRSGPA